MLENLTFEKENHIYKWKGQTVPSITQMFCELGLVDTRWFKAEDALRGEFVHLACMQYNHDVLDFDNLDDILKPYVQAYIDFVEISGFKPHLEEFKVFHEDFMYAGCLDITGDLNGKYIEIDIKSGGCQWWVELQLNAYCQALERMGMKVPRRLFSLQVTKDAKLNLKEYRKSNCFNNVINLYNMKKRR